MALSLDLVRQTAPSPASPEISLADLPAGEYGVVIHLAGGSELLGRMATLGLTPGTEITVLRNSGRGPLIVLARNTRIALGRGEARKIRVRRGEQ
ncbi:MAG: ferrous iron transport protein A [Anaerolineae bacterium]|nr:ferrous iron transport protein A [Anaerolineae bacterium]